jgi:hypothetical protein
MRTNRPAALAAALALTALLSACGGGGDDDTGDVATLGDDSTDATSGDGTTADTEAEAMSAEDAALAFAECMRENGIEMDDPQMDDGGMAIAIGGEGGDIDEEALEAAHEECQPIMDNATPPEGFEPPSDEEIQEMQDEALEAAQCMREHGYDWPDPVFEDGGRMTQTMGGEDSDIDFEDPQFQADQEECMGGQGAVFSAGGPGGSDGATVEGSGDRPDVIAPSDGGDE